MKRVYSGILGLASVLLFFVAGCANYATKYGPPPIVPMYGAPQPRQKPGIVRVDHDAGKTLRKGDTVHFTVETDAPWPTPAPSVDEIRILIPQQPAIQLYNDGTNGDKVAGDNLLERDYTIGSENRKTEAANVVASSSGGQETVAEKPITIDP